jgi:hypothetical protein
VTPWLAQESLIVGNDKPYLYDAEEDDERFLESINTWILKQFGNPITVDTFEAMITRLEILTGPKDDLMDVIPLNKAKAELVRIE